jgi:hypothetical protein
MDKGEAKGNFALSDFIAPNGTPDYVGGFAVTAGIGEEDAGEFIRLKLGWFGSVGFTDGLLGKRVGTCERQDRQAEQEDASEGGLRHGPARCGKGSLASRWLGSNF